MIAEATEEWRKARAVIDSVYQLAEWLEQDLPARFAEMLGVHPGAARRLKPN